MAAKKKDLGMCEKPDRDEPRIKCGYPRPCPWHSATITENTVIIPYTAPKVFAVKDRLLAIKQAVKK